MSGSPTRTPTAVELAATSRYVATTAPHLNLALVWAIVTNPEAVDALRDGGTLLVEPAHLLELAALDPALEAVVETSGPALLRAGRIPGPPAAGSDAPTRPVPTVADLADWVRHVATLSPELLPAALARLVRRTSSRLTLQAFAPTAADVFGLASLRCLVAAADSITDPPETVPGGAARIQPPALPVASPTRRGTMTDRTDRTDRPAAAQADLDEHRPAEQAADPVDLAAAQAELAAVAVALDAIRGRLVRLKDELDEGDAWTPEICTGDDPTPLSFHLFASLETLLADHVEPGIDLLRLAAVITQDEVLEDWSRTRGRTVAAALLDELGAVASKLAKAPDDEGDDASRADLREIVAGIAHRAVVLQIHLTDDDEDDDLDEVADLDDEGKGEP